MRLRSGARRQHTRTVPFPARGQRIEPGMARQPPSRRFHHRLGGGRETPTALAAACGGRPPSPAYRLGRKRCRGGAPCNITGRAENLHADLPKQVRSLRNPNPSSTARSHTCPNREYAPRRTHRTKCPVLGQFSCARVPRNEKSHGKSCFGQRTGMLCGRDVLYGADSRVGNAARSRSRRDRINPPRKAGIDLERPCAGSARLSRLPEAPAGRRPAPPPRRPGRGPRARGRRPRPRPAGPGPRAARTGCRSPRTRPAPGCRFPS